MAETRIGDVDVDDVNSIAAYLNANGITTYREAVTSLTHALAVTAGAAEQPLSLSRGQRHKVNAAMRQLKTACVLREAANEPPVSSASSSASASSSSSSSSPHSGLRVLVLTGYSDDYWIGDLCQAVNRRYACRHGHRFLASVQPYRDIMRDIAPRGHCAWLKVLLINRVLCAYSRYSGRPSAAAGTVPSSSSSPSGDKEEEALFEPLFAEGDGPRSLRIAPSGEEQGKGEGQGEGVPLEYILWVDADALVVRPELSLQSLLLRVQQLHDGHFSAAGTCSGAATGEDGSVPVYRRDLLLAEDMNPGCLLNSGVMLVRVQSQWSVDFWREVWTHPASRRFHHTFFYEQSAMLLCLRRHLEGLAGPRGGEEAKNRPPFHSYQGGAPVKATAHVCVVPHQELNTNRGAFNDTLPPLQDTAAWASQCLPRFIFHAAGIGDKLRALLNAARLYGVKLPVEFLKAQHRPSSAPSPPVPGQEEGPGANIPPDTAEGEEVAVTQQGRGQVDDLRGSLRAFRLLRGKHGTAPSAQVLQWAQRQEQEQE